MKQNTSNQRNAKKKNDGTSKNKQAVRHDAQKAEQKAAQEVVDLLKSRIKNFEELKNEYTFPEENLTSKIILKYISECLEGYIKTLIQLLQPEEFHSLHECGAFDDNEKAKLFDTYKNLMVMHREILKAEIQNDENNNIATIALVDAELRLLKPTMIRIVQKMQSSWKNVTTKDGGAKYFG